ncbi:cilia- and flagella-associated protein 61 [Thalassophryne amazonica]|uniref:cilia- and flagella-associated protein 61 n=1 Tax=Thalassophryne amazonica TaxID=390379 RepID=UPI001471D1ED|nr:cilia- and flagella-associated protein 61 [Thalassophryne amazonica]
MVCLSCDVFFHEEMKTTVSSDDGRVETVAVRRSESADAPGIDGLISPSAVAVFGRVNAVTLLEKANLAVTLANDQNQVLAHAAFFDYPAGDLVDQADWEEFLQKHFRAEKCTSLNTLFLHLFVALPGFAKASLQEIMRAVFCAIPELEYVCLLSPVSTASELALDEVFELLLPLGDLGPQCLAVCHRHEHYPRLHIRPARVEDHDDIMRLFAEQTNLLSDVNQPYFLVEIIEAENEDHHVAVCEMDGITVGFVHITTEVVLENLQDDFELFQFDGFYAPVQPKCHAAAGQRGSQTSTSQQEETQPTVTAGEQQRSHKPNVFCIQIFVMDKTYEMRSVDVLPYIFRVFPDRDYCAMTVHLLAPELVLLQNFIRVAARATSSPLCDLYLLHRSGLSTVAVRLAVAADRPAVCHLVKGLRLHESLLQDLDQFYKTIPDSLIQHTAPLHAFVAVTESQVVGIVIIKNEQDVEYICAHYNIENFIYFSQHGEDEHAQLCHFVLQSSFQIHTKQVFKEVLRLAHKSCLYFRNYPSHNIQENSCIHHLDFVLNSMVPVRPRCQIIYPLEELGTNAPSKTITEEQPPFALSFISRKLSMEPKVTVNERIVVVGASSTGLSFLEELTFCPHLKFNNLTLISTHGFPGDYNHDNAGFLHTSHAYSSRDLAQLPVRSCIRVVTGKMVGINRTDRYVLLSDGGKVSYHQLILCTGTQYQVPCPTVVDVNQQITNSQLSTGCHRYTGHVPSNLFTLNDAYDCMAARHWLCTNFVELEDNAVVYGSGIDVYTTVETLLSLGVQGSRLHLVMPATEPGVSCFMDPAVETAVAMELMKAQVRVHHNCVLAQMNNGDHPEPLTSVSFMTDEEPVHLQCGVFINLSNRRVDYDAFKSINEAFLVYDGRLVIDTMFNTNDPAIFGAGPLTKFSRRYRAPEWSHTNFNSKEVGQDLAATLLSLYDPTLDHTVESTSKMDYLIPQYKQAKIQAGKLPGGFNFLYVTKPSATNPAAPPVQHLQDRVIVTGQAEMGNYFCLHLSHYHVVESLTCLSLEPRPFSNYLCLYGKHQKLLGQLLDQYQQGLVPNLYSFFNQRWCLAIYHDRFSDFEKEIQQMTSSESTDDIIKQDVMMDTKLLPQDGVKDAGMRAALRTSAVNYLMFNRNLLPMFACPDQH